MGAQSQETDGGGMNGTVNLPWPPRDLWPNVKKCAMCKYRVAKKYRRDCWIIALGAGLTANKYASIYLTITFHPTSKRRYDLDNCTASIKAGLDGIADALKVDDWQFRISAVLADPR